MGEYSWTRPCRVNITTITSLGNVSCLCISTKTFKQTHSKVLGSLIDSLSRQIMLRKVTLMALLGVAVAEVSNYDSVHSPYTYDSVHSPYTTKYDPLQHYFGVRQDGLLNMDPMVAGLGVGVLNAGYTTIVSLLNAQKTRNVCNKMNEVLNVAELTSTQAGLASVTNFKMTKFLTAATATTLTGSATLNGVTLTTAQHSKIATTTGPITSDGSNIGVTAQDFETFRAAVNTANLALQAKIDEILKKSTLACN